MHIFSDMLIVHKIEYTNGIQAFVLFWADVLNTFFVKVVNVSIDGHELLFDFCDDFLARLRRRSNSAGCSII